MASSSVQPESSDLRSEDHLELQNPREEAPYTQYYPDLDSEEPLPLFTFSSSKVYSTVAENTVGLQEYSEKQKRVDQIRQGRLKFPSFRKISQTDDSTVPDGVAIHHLKSLSLLEKLGFYNINEDKNKTLDLPAVYFRPDLHKDALIRGKLLYNSKSFQVHYDMDETDLFFLNWLNELSKQEISMEQFEIIISFFETKIFQIERLLPPTIKDRSTIDYQQQQHALLYGSDDGTGCAHQDEQACAVCDSSECDSSNSIVFCDGCDIAVHQDCYGVSFIPEGPWLCRRCLIARNTVEKCIFCPSITGAFKQTDGGDWAHVLCTLWTPVLYFANPIYMEPIEGVENIPKSRWKLICYICKQKVGVCIQCSKQTCFAAYHVTCAKRAGLYMKMKKSIKSAINDKSSLVSFCDKHTPNEWASTHDVKKGIDKTRLYFHDRKSHVLDEHVNNDLTLVTNEEYKELMSSQSKKFAWRLNPNIYVIPSVVIEELIKFHIDNKLPDISKLTLNQIAKYYTLKRQYMGKPLIKRPDVFNHATLPEQELENRDNAVNYFSQDTKKLLELTKLVAKRSKADKALVEDKLETATMMGQPKKWVFCNLVQFFKAHFASHYQPALPKYAVKPTIYQIIEKCDNGEYVDIETLIYDIERFSEWLTNLNLHPNSSIQEMQKLFKGWQRYKKVKYQNAREYDEVITKYWASIKDEFQTNDGLDYKIKKTEVEGTIQDSISSVKKQFKGNTEMKRLGIDISDFLKYDKIVGRHLRKRKTSLDNTDGENNIAGGVLKARLNRVKLRTDVQNLRKSTRLRKK